MDYIKNFINKDDIFFVGEFKKRSEGKNLLTFDWKLSNELRKDKRGRIYFFIEIDENHQKKILKIGKSNDKNGLNGTLGFYVNTLSGTPSITRFSLHHLIYEKLNENKNILVYCKFSDSIKKEIFGMFERREVMIPLDVTYIEELCLEEYYNFFSTYPEWNFKEGGKELPLYLIENYSKFIQNKKNTRIK